MHREKWNARYREKELLWPREPSALLREETKHLEPGRALDLAAGEGRNAFYLARHGWEVTAVDFSDVAIAKGKELAEKLELPIEWLVRDLTSYEPQSDHFDLVSLFYLQVPREELRTVLKNALSALRPGGTLLVVGHDTMNLREGTGGPQDPAVLYSYTDITDALDGVEVERAERQYNPVDHGDHPEGALQVDCVVRARKR